MSPLKAFLHKGAHQFSVGSSVEEVFGVPLKAEYKRSAYVFKALESLEPHSMKACLRGKGLRLRFK